MTIKEIVDITKLSRITIQRKIKELFPEIIKNGKKTDLTENQVFKIIDDLKKKGFISPVQNEQVAVQNEQVISKIDRLENIVEKLCGAVANLISSQSKQPLQIEMKQDYFSILGYCNFKGILLAYSEAVRYGKEAARLSIERGLEIRKIPDERFGKVGSYNVSILNELFEM